MVDRPCDAGARMGRLVRIGLLTWHVNAVHITANATIAACLVCARAFCTGHASVEQFMTRRFTVQVIKALGKGSYGVVYKVQRLADGQEYAMKETDMSKMGHQERSDAVNEIRLLGSLNHPNVSYRMCYSTSCGAVQLAMSCSVQRAAKSIRAVSQ